VCERERERGRKREAEREREREVERERERERERKKRINGARMWFKSFLSSNPSSLQILPLSSQVT